MMPSTAANPGSTLSFDLSSNILPQFSYVKGANPLLLDPPYSSIPTLSPQHTQAFHPVASTETALHELNSASPVVVHLGESTTTNSASRKKKRRPKFELASLVAKDLEELSRKRAIKQEPVGDVDSLLEMARPNGTPVFTSPAGEASVGSSSICLADIKTSGVVSTDASSINVGTKHDHGPVREASRSNTASVRLCVRFPFHDSIHQVSLGSDSRLQKRFHGNWGCDQYTSSCIFIYAGIWHIRLILQYTEWLNKSLYQCSGRARRG